MVACRPFDSRSNASTSGAGAQSPGFHGSTTTDLRRSDTPDVEVRRPAETEAGDLLVAVVYTDDSHPVEMPAGWDRIDSRSFPCTTTGTVDWAYHATAPTDPPTWLFHRSETGSADLQAIVAAYGGVGTDGPSIHAVSDGIAAPVDVPSLAVEAANTVVVAAFAMEFAPDEWQSPPEMLQRATVYRLALFEQVRTAAGATPRYTAGGDICHVGAAIAFRPQR
jgi:hypothetical protein